MMRRLVAVVLVAAGCAGPPADGQLTVFAAASLRDAFTELGRTFDGPDVAFNFGGSGRLAVQIENGSPAAVFASADPSIVDRLERSGVVERGTRFAYGRLAIAVAPGNPLGLRGLQDLDRDAVSVVLAAPDVPAGRYAREALAGAGVAVRPVSEELDVRAVVAKVALGEADAGVVYFSDIVAARGAVDHVEIPERDNVRAAYSVAVVGSAPAARAFVDHLLSPRGRSVLRRFGFDAP